MNAAQVHWRAGLPTPGADVQRMPDREAALGALHATTQTLICHAEGTNIFPERKRPVARRSESKGMEQAEVKIRIRLPDASVVADLEIVTPIRVDAVAHVFGTLAGIRIRPWSHYTVTTVRNTITRARLTEEDGSRISQRRAGQVLDTLLAALRPRGSA